MSDKTKGKKAVIPARERRAVLFLLPLVATLGVVLYFSARPHFGKDELPGVGDTYAQEISAGRPIPVDDAPRHSEPSGSRGGEAGALAERFAFDPNTVTYEQMRRMGIAKGTAAGIVKYRERGKVFQIPEDFATCYGITDSMYVELKPYIRIGEEFRVKPFAPVGRTGADAARAAEVDVPSGVPDASAGQSAAAAYSDARRRVLVDINSADSLELVAVRGVGPRTAEAIIDYRERLGGFHNVAQVAELSMVTERNFELMCEQIWADSCGIRKIDINFASPNAVGSHPYIPAKLLRRVLKNRQLRGGWRTIEDMMQDNTLTQEEAERLAPYLHFAARPQ